MNRTQRRRRCTSATFFFVFALTLSGLRAVAQPLPAAKDAHESEPQYALAHFAGRPVAGVVLEPLAGESTAALKRLLKIPLDAPLELNRVQAAVLRLFALGRFAQVEVSGSPIEKGVGRGSVVLTFHLEPIVRVQRIDLLGLGPVSQRALRDALQIGPGDEIEPLTGPQLKKRVARHLAHTGFPLAQARIRMVPGREPSLFIIEVWVTPGPTARVTSIEFSGQRSVSDALLRDLLATRRQSVVGRDTLEADRKTLLEAYLSHGYLTAQVASPRVEHEPQGAHVVFSIESGPRFVREITGAHLMSPQSLEALWPEQDGSLTQATLPLWRERVLETYRRLGLTDASVDVMQQAKDSNTQFILMKIREGPETRVVGYRFPGATAFSETLLRTQIEQHLSSTAQEEGLFSSIAPDVAPRGHQAARRRGSFVPARHRFNREGIEEAVALIRAAYQDLGFLSAEVGPLTFDRQRDSQETAAPDGPSRGTVTVPIAEGPQTFVDAIRFTGIDSSPLPLLETIARPNGDRPLGASLRAGAPYSAAAVEDGRIALVRYYRDQGYLGVKVFVETLDTRLEHEKTVSFAVTQGPQTVIDEVLLRGNRKTREGVIRSRMTLDHNRIYKLSEALSDQRSIGELGTFSQVRVRLLDEAHPSPLKDLVAEVSERPRQLVEIVPGISTTNGPRLRLSYSHINVFGTASTFTASLRVNRQLFFDLFGRYAENLRERYASYHGARQLTHGIEREARLELKSPPLKFLPTDPLLRLDLVDQRINAVRYSLDATTAIFGIDLAVARRVKPTFETQIGRSSLECPLGDACDQSLDVRRMQGGRPIQKGNRWTFKLAPLFVYEGRNSPLSPSSGFFANARTTFALGGARPQKAYVPFTFVKYEAQLTSYFPLLGAVVALSARAGTIDLRRGLVPIDERFFMGGRDSLRGFVESTLIPEDACVVDDEDAPLPPHCAEGITRVGGPPLSLGGNTFALLKTELRLPLTKTLSFDIFADLGNLWVNLLRAHSIVPRVGCGVGLRYATPVGALALDLGINPARRTINQEPSFQLHFSIGSF